MEFTSEAVCLERLSSCTHEEEQRLRKLRVMNGSGAHDLIPIHVNLPLTAEIVDI